MLGQLMGVTDWRGTCAFKSVEPAAEIFCLSF